MALSVHVNVDSQDQPLGTSGVDFVQFSEGNDQIIFTGGNTQVQDGADVPTQSELISAGIDLSSVTLPFTVEKYLLQDTSEVLLKDIDGMGDNDFRYVLAFDFDAGTASEPVLEVWDDNELNSANGTMLGGGTPSSSFIRGVTTTSASPGAGWASGATRMAGSSDGHFLFLNNENGFLTGASTLYANLAVIVPSSQTIGFSANPVFVCKFLSN